MIIDYMYRLMITDCLLTHRFHALLGHVMIECIHVYGRPLLLRVSVLINRIHQPKLLVSEVIYHNRSSRPQTFIYVYYFTGFLNINISVKVNVLLAYYPLRNIKNSPHDVIAVS